MNHPGTSTRRFGLQEAALFEHCAQRREAELLQEAAQARLGPQTHNFVGIDPNRRGGAKLADLLAAFNQLKVEAKDRIAIIKEIERSGKLHAKLIME